MAYAKSLTANHIMSLFNRYLRKTAEQTLYATPVLYEFAKKAPIPGGSGKTIFIPKHYGRNGIRSLTEASPIGLCATSTHYYSATVSGFGDARGYSDFLVAIKEIPTMLADDIRSMTEFAGQKVDSMIRTQICTAGTWVSPDGNTGNTDVIETTAMKQRFFFDAYATLAGNDAPRYGDGNYWAALHPFACHDVFVGTSNGSAGAQLGGGFMETTDVGAKKLMDAQIGKLAGIRVFETTTTPKIANGVGGVSEGANSGYAAYVMGPGAVGAVDLANSKLRTYIKPLGSAGGADPIDQYMTAGVKFYFAAVAMDTANRLVRSASGSTL